MRYVKNSKHERFALPRCKNGIHLNLLYPFGQFAHNSSTPTQNHEKWWILTKLYPLEKDQFNWKAFDNKELHICETVYGFYEIT